MNIRDTRTAHRDRKLLQPLSSSSKARDPRLTASPEYQSPPESQDARSSTARKRILARRVSLPLWSLVLSALCLVLTPAMYFASPGWTSIVGDSSSPADAEVLALSDDSSSSDPTQEHTSVAAPSSGDKGVEVWGDPATPTQLQREEYMRSQGIEPNRDQLDDAAGEVERLQAELEAIQRNSAQLRSLTRQQSGDLSLAYSSLEATEEEKEGALQDLRTRIDELESQVNSVDELAVELRGLLGLPQAQDGVGGPSGAETLEAPAEEDPWRVLRSDIVSIEQRAASLILSLDEVNTEVQLRLLKVRNSGLPYGAGIYDDLAFYDSMPVGWPVEGQITSRFGVRSNPFQTDDNGEGSHENHTGLDIAVPLGTPVRATGAGTVRLASEYGGYGMLVIIDHGRGVSTWYGHNSRFAVTPGQAVDAGDVVAYAGSTGRSTGSHVHYEVRIDEIPIDPWPHTQQER